MADLKQHMADCERFLGSPHREVHEWIDEYAANLGPLHRKVRHHRQGIEHARRLFGDAGSRAAAIHILRDCRNIPDFADYASGRVDPLGLPRVWPVTAYIHYPEREFEELVMSELSGPTGVVLWAFTDEAGIALIAGASRFTPDEVIQKAQIWSEAVQARKELAPSSEMIDAHPILSPHVQDYVTQVKSSPLFAAIAQQHPASEFLLVELDELITPLVYVDKEYVDELRAELQGTEEVDVAKFAIPLAITSKVKAAMDPTMRGVTFISPQKTLAVSPAQVRQTPDGVEVRFVVTNSFSAIVVGKYGGRYYLRNGIHRAFLLRSLGITTAPCLLIEEQNPPPVLSQAYPTFAASVLSLERPPLLKDYFDPKLTIEIPLQRTHKIIKISPDETIIPAD